MADDTLKQIRRMNLRRWIDDDPVADGNVAKWCDYYSVYLEKDEKPFNPNHIRQYIPQGDREPHGSIGENLARKIERALGRPKYSMDEPHPDDKSQINEERAHYGKQAIHNSLDELMGHEPSRAQLVAKAFRVAPEYQQAIVEAILGMRRLDELPEGAGDAIRLGLKLASSGRRGGDEEEVA